MPSLTQKELMALDDQLNQEQLLVKKFRSYASTAQDGQLRMLCEQQAKRHKQHYDTLMGYLY
ncbi:MAG: spore coat protein [Oscillospiraceae bacterium]|jgi:hypothetical protein|nr:spore coat protein [Oscillospiraceae bacterium]